MAQHRSMSRWSKSLRLCKHDGLNKQHAAEELMIMQNMLCSPVAERLHLS